MPEREILWIEFAEPPPEEVRVELKNLLWWWVPGKKRWEWRSVSTQPKHEVIGELRRRLDALGFDLDAEAEWGID